MNAQRGTLESDSGPDSLPKKFCTACGASLNGEVRFCPSCGTAVGGKASEPSGDSAADTSAQSLPSQAEGQANLLRDEGIHPEAVPLPQNNPASVPESVGSHPKVHGFGIAVKSLSRKKSTLVAFISVILVLLLALGIPNWRALASAMGLIPSNPIAVTLSAAQNLLEASSAEAELSIDNGSTHLTFSGSFQLGDDVESSMADFTGAASGSNEAFRVAWSHGAYAMQNGKSYDYGSSTQIRTDLSNVSYGCNSLICYDGKSIYKAEQAAVSKKHWDIQGAYQAFNEQLGKSTDSRDYHQSAELPKVSSDEQQEIDKEAEKSLKVFVGKTLEDKDTQSKVFIDNKTSSANGDTKLAYSIDLEQLIHAASRYMLDSRESYPALSDYINRMLRGQKDNYQHFFSQNLNFRFDGGEQPEIDVTLVHGRNGDLRSLDCTINTQRGYPIGFSLTIKDKNKAKVDGPSLDAFMQTARTRRSY